jgi:hypothetical protein
MIWLLLRGMSRPIWQEEPDWRDYPTRLALARIPHAQTRAFPRGMYAFERERGENKSRKFSSAEPSSSYLLDTAGANSIDSIEMWEFGCQMTSLIRLAALATCLSGHIERVLHNFKQRFVIPIIFHSFDDGRTRRA